MFDPQKIEDLFKKQFELDCQSIQLLHPISGDIVFEGPGIIKQNSSIFEFKIFSKSKIDVMGREIDEYFDEETGYKFKILDYKNKVWSFNTFTVTFSSTGIITGKVDKLNYVDNMPYDIPDYIRITIFDQNKFPITNIDKIEKRKNKIPISIEYIPISEYENEWIKIKAEKSDDIVTLDVFSEMISLNSHFDLRIIEGLQFVLGKKIQPAVTQVKVKNNVTVTISSEGHFPPNNIEPPIEVSKYYNVQSIYSWKLFSKYLEFEKDFDEGMFHPMGAQINGVINSGNSSFETKFLVLSVAVEGILVKLYKDYAEPDKKFKDNVDDLIEYFSNWKVDERIIKRVKPQIENMKMSRTKDILLELKKNEVIKGSHLKSWERIRHRSAHGHMNLSENPNKIKKFLKDYYCVLELFYRLIFYKIGYDGKLQNTVMNNLLRP